MERKYPEILTAKEVELFLEQPECVDAKGFRDHAMLELLYATGIRVSELIALDIGGPEPAGGLCPLLQQRKGADHPPVPRRGEGASGLYHRASGPS